MRVETRKMIVSDVFGLEQLLQDRGLLGRVLITEARMVDPRYDFCQVRLSSPHSLSPKEAAELKAFLIEKAADIIGAGRPDKMVFLRPISASPGADTPAR